MNFRVLVNPADAVQQDVDLYPQLPGVAIGWTSSEEGADKQSAAKVERAGGRSIADFPKMKLRSSL